MKTCNLQPLKKCKNTFVARQLNMCLPQAAAAVFSCPCNQSHLSGNSHFLRSETPETPKSHSIIVSSSSKQISRQFKVTLLCNRFEHWKTFVRKHIRRGPKWPLWVTQWTCSCSHFHFVGNGARLPPCRHHETKKYTAIMCQTSPSGDLLKPPASILSKLDYQETCKRCVIGNGTRRQISPTVPEQKRESNKLLDRHTHNSVDQQLASIFCKRL